MVPVRFLQVVDLVLSLDLGDKQRFGLPVHDAGIGRALEPHRPCVGLLGEIHPHRVADVGIVTDDVFETGEGDVLFEPAASPEDALRFRSFCGHVRLPVVDLPVALEQLTWRVLLGRWDR